MAHLQKQAIDANGSQRVEELDYLKGIMIVLMISFHLVYIGDSYPYFKQVVYTFHMPVFLIISGYLMNIVKPRRQYILTIFRLAVPYVVIESGYIIAASLFPIREHINNLTLNVFLIKLFIHPLGPYWYLHTMILCGLAYYVIFHIRCISLLSRYILIGIAYALFAKAGLLSFHLSLYFLVGIVIRNSTHTFLQIFCPSFLSFLGAGLLAANPVNLHTDSVGGVLIIYLVVSGSLACYPYLANKISRNMVYLGKNTLSLFLFSPIFTIMCKSFVPIFSFEPTGMLFLLCSLIICILGSLGIKKTMDECRLSSFFFGPRR